MHEVDVHVVGLQPVEALAQLAGDRLRVAVRRVGTLADHHDVRTDATVADPLAEHAFARAAPVDVGGVERRATALDEVVEHHRRMRQGRLVVDAHHQSRDLLADAGNLARTASCGRPAGRADGRAPWGLRRRDARPGRSARSPAATCRASPSVPSVSSQLICRRLTVGQVRRPPRLPPRRTTASARRRSPRHPRMRRRDRDAGAATVPAGQPGFGDDEVSPRCRSRGRHSPADWPTPVRHLGGDATGELQGGRRPSRRRRSRHMSDGGHRFGVGEGPADRTPGDQASHRHGYPPTSRIPPPANSASQMRLPGRAWTGTRTRPGSGGSVADHAVAEQLDQALGLRERSGT